MRGHSGMGRLIGAGGGPVGRGWGLAEGAGEGGRQGLPSPSLRQNPFSLRSKGHPLSLQA
jgi:hypothetical protein